MSSEPESETFPTVVFRTDNSKCTEVLFALKSIVTLTKIFFLLVTGIDKGSNAKGF